MMSGFTYKSMRIGLTFGGRTWPLRAHRVVYALTHGHWPPEHVDHENGVEAGNGIANLRPATHAENCQNLKINPRNTSGYPGVHWNKLERKWTAQIKAYGRNVYLGYFDKAEAAFPAYCAAKAIVHPFQPVQRGVAMPELHAVDRLRTAHGIVKAARGRGDGALEIHAWDHFLGVKRPPQPHRAVVDRLRSLRGPGESYSDVILRLRAKLDAYAEPVTPAALNIELGHLERHAQGLRGKEFSQLRIEEMSPYTVGQSSVVVVVVGLAQRWQRHPSYCHRN
jgi:hypothetical protein